MSQIQVFNSKLILLSASVQAVTWAWSMREDVQLTILDYKITTISSHLSAPTLVSAMIHSGDGRYIVTRQKFHWNSESREGRLIVRRSAVADNGDVYITHWLHCKISPMTRQQWPGMLQRCKLVEEILSSPILFYSRHFLLIICFIKTINCHMMSHDVVTAPI